MDILKKIWPHAFKVAPKDVAALVIHIVIFAVLSMILPAITALVAIILGGIPFIGALILWALGVVSGVVGLYAVVSIVLGILHFCDVLK